MSALSAEEEKVTATICAGVFRSLMAQVEATGAGEDLAAIALVTVLARLAARTNAVQVSAGDVWSRLTDDSIRALFVLYFDQERARAFGGEPP